MFGSMLGGNTPSGFLVEVRFEEGQRAKAFDQCFGSKKHLVCM